MMGDEPRDFSNVVKHRSMRQVSTRAHAYDGAGFVLIIQRPCRRTVAAHTTGY